MRQCTPRAPLSLVQHMQLTQQNRGPRNESQPEPGSCARSETRKKMQTPRIPLALHPSRLVRMCQNPLVRTPQYGNSVIEEATKRAQRGVRLHVVSGNAKAPGEEDRRTTMCDERGTIPTQLGESTDPVVLRS